MSRRSTYEDDYDDIEHDEHKSPRKFKKEEKNTEKKKKWDRESLYDRDHDYDERR